MKNEASIAPAVLGLKISQQLLSTSLLLQGVRVMGETIRKRFFDNMSAYLTCACKEERLKVRGAQKLFEIKSEQEEAI